MDEIQKKLNLYLESDHIKKIREIREGRFGLNLVSGMRNLSAVEIRQLEAQGNNSEAWNRILVSHDFTADFVNGNRFFGDCHLGRFDGSLTDTGNGASLPCGIFDSIINSSAVCSGAAIYRCGIISNYVISSGSVLYNIGTVSAGNNLSFANGKIIPVGPETEERATGIFAELNMSTTEQVLSNRSYNNIYNEFLAAYTSLCILEKGFIGEHCIIRDTTSLTDSFVDGSAIITGALSVSGSTIMSSPDETTIIGSGTEIENSIVQQGCHVSSGAGIYSSLVMEHAETEKRCIINSSIIGPNSTIGEGEITSTVAGPFTAAHHQSMLIACIWTSGRGNVGYGANVGSNHTSRLPDQELFPGEGMFFGLGSSIKFPADFRLSPYTVISTGAVTLPQRMEFPFSLITQPSRINEEIPAVYNELKPAWMLSDNLYTLVRNESKYRKRNKAKHDRFEFAIIRPGTVDMMINARERLKGAGGKRFYTGKDIPGAGKNFITDISVKKGIETYDFFIRYYTLFMYARRCGRLVAESIPVTAETALDDDPGMNWWNHARTVMKNEELSVNVPAKNMEAFIEMTRKVYSITLNSKQKDYERGCNIIEDYSMYHELTEHDPVIRDLRSRTDIEIKRAEQIITLVKQQ